MYSMELGRSPVISSDTSGIWLKDDFAFASCGHDIICFDLKVGKNYGEQGFLGFVDDIFLSLIAKECIIQH